jgi:murein DD-endopeptidase MepM/ murein hydrolase activator NlpD
MNSRRTFSLILFLFIACNIFAQEQKLDRFLTVAKRFGEYYNANNYRPIVEEMFDDQLKKELPFAVLQPLLDKIRQDIGAITKMGVAEKESENVAVIPVEFQQGVMDLKLALTKDDKVSGLIFKEHEKSLTTPSVNGTHFSLPFKGTWYVLWGGDTKQENYHHDIQNQKYAIDLTKLGPDGRRYKTDGKSNEDYYAFGQEILAPAGGRVTEAIDGVRDNAPGTLNQYSSVGNCVIIQHSDSECSVLSYLKRGSVKVRAGDTVKAGQVIGQCGNSGNSSEPHLQYHLQNSPLLQIATGIKAYFDAVGIKNHPDESLIPERYSPVKGDIIFPKK